MEKIQKMRSIFRLSKINGFSRRGQLSMETIIIIILALIVLVVVAAAFSGGMAALWKKIIGISETYTQVDIDAAKNQCQSSCNLGQKDAFCTQKFPLVGDKTCRDLQVSCPAITC